MSTRTIWQSLITVLSSFTKRVRVCVCRLRISWVSSRLSGTASNSPRIPKAVLAFPLLADLYESNPEPTSSDILKVLADSYPIVSHSFPLGSTKEEIMGWLQYMARLGVAIDPPTERPDPWKYGLCGIGAMFSNRWFDWRSVDV